MKPIVMVFICFLIGVSLPACARPPEVIEVTREVIQTALPQEGVPVVSCDLILRATEVMCIAGTPEAVESTPAPTF